MVSPTPLNTPCWQLKELEGLQFPSIAPVLLPWTQVTLLTLEHLSKEDFKHDSTADGLSHFLQNMKTWGKWFRSSKARRPQAAQENCSRRSRSAPRMQERRPDLWKAISWAAFFLLPLSFPDINDLCPNLSSQSITQ